MGCRSQGKLNYEQTQFISGHGDYRVYGHRFGQDKSPCSQRCDNVVMLYLIALSLVHTEQGDRRQTLKTQKYCEAPAGVNGGLEVSFKSSFGRKNSEENKKSWRRQ